MFAEVCDVGGVVFAVPFVHEEEPVDIFLAGFRMDYGAGEVFFFHTVPGEVPAFVEGVEERLRDGDGGFGVGEFGPLGFFVRLDRGIIFGEREAKADEGVHVAVGSVVDDLADGPAPVAIWRVDLRVVESGDGGAQLFWS